jgi:demethylmenaquinone methyltransferase/2-methoxy-6-polyprenyl-1,4-benzoquinol methylase
MKRSEKTNYPLKEYYSHIYKSYDLVNRVFTLGLDNRWRKDAANKCLSYDPGKIIDLCCGTGDVVVQLAESAKRKISVTGYDFNSEMLEYAKAKVLKKNINGIDFIQGDAANMPFEKDSFDCMTIAFGFRNLCYNNSQSEKHLHEMNRVLNKAGKLVILESGVPSSTIIKLFYRLYLHLFLIPLGGILSGNWKAYKYLAKSAENFYTIDELEILLKKFGFKLLYVKRYFLGAANLIIAEKQSE